MIYQRPQIFGNNDAYSACGFLCDLVSTPLMEHVSAEAARLTPIFDAAAKALAPYTKSNKQKRTLSADGLHQIFRQSAAAFGHMTYGQPLMIGEKLISSLRNYIKENDIDLSFTAVIPDGGKHKDRMFQTATFGFFSLESKTNQDAYPKRIICPFYIIPDDFLHHSNATDLLKEAAEMSYWFNHDYFHQMIYVAFDKDSFTHRHSTAPGESCLLPPMDSNFFNIDLLGPVTRRFETAWDQGKIARSFGMATHIEPWAMRFHREVLVAMNESNNNPMRQALDRFIDSYAASNLPQSQTKMTDPAIYPQEYAMRLVAFNLLRAEPLEHPLVQHAINCFRDIAQTCPETPSDMVDPQDVFAQIYKTNFTETFFGAGYNEDIDMTETYDDAEDYAGRVMGASVRSLELAARDAKTALKIASFPALKYTLFRNDHTLA